MYNFIARHILAPVLDFSRGTRTMKCLRELNNPEYKHLPDFASVEEHGAGNPVTMRKGNGDAICEMEWDEFKKVYV